MKITRKELETALEALEDAFPPGDSPIGESYDASQVAGMLWRALRSLQDPARECPAHKVTMTVEAELAGIIDARFTRARDYDISVKSRIDPLFDMMNARITRMEIS